MDSKKRKRGRRIFNPGHLSVPVLCTSSRILAQLRDGETHCNFPEFVLAETATLLFPSQESAFVTVFSKTSASTQLTQLCEATRTYYRLQTLLTPLLLFRFLSRAL